VPPARGTRNDDKKPNDELMRRLVEAVEGYVTQAKADRAAKDADQKREVNAIGAVVWALLGFAWLSVVQRGPVSHFVTSNWGALPVLVPVFALVAAFGYRAFRLRVLKVSLIYAVAGMVVLTEVYFMLGTTDQLVRVFNIVLGYAGLWYFLLGASNLDDDEVSGQAINNFVNQRGRWVAIVVVVLFAVGTIWYLLAPESGLQLALTGLLLVGGSLFVVIRAVWSRVARVVSRLQRKPPAAGG
jgi:hypothetical protein